jgi:hypothetical protein
MIGKCCSRVENIDRVEIWVFEGQKRSQYRPTSMAPTPSHKWQNGGGSFPPTPTRKLVRLTVASVRRVPLGVDEPRNIMAGKMYALCSLRAAMTDREYSEYCTAEPSLVTLTCVIRK